MLTILAAAFALASQGPPAPETVTTGNVILRVPAGWKYEQKEAGCFLRPADLSEEDAFVVIVFPGRHADGNLAELFERSWKQVAGQKKVLSRAPGRETKTESGVDGLMTVGLLETAEGSRLIATLAVFKPGDRAEMVLALTGQDRLMQSYRGALGAFLRGLRFQNVELPTYEVLLALPAGTPP